MKDNYDFSKGVRGKFASQTAQFKLPVYLDEEVQAYLSSKAEAKGMELSDLINGLLKQQIAIIETVK